VRRGQSLINEFYMDEGHRDERRASSLTRPLAINQGRKLNHGEGHVATDSIKGLQACHHGKSHD